LTAADPRLKNLLLVYAGAAMLLLLIIGWELDWGGTLQRPAMVHTLPAPEAVPLALLKDIQSVPTSAFSETVERPLLTPTRRPSPPAAAPEVKRRMARGEFVLMGTTIAGSKSFALLRDANGTKQRRVAQGDILNGSVVDKIEAGQVTLRLDDETEILALKTAVSPRRQNSNAPQAAPRSSMPPAVPQIAAPARPASGAGDQPAPKPGSRRVVRADGKEVTEKGGAPAGSDVPASAGQAVGPSTITGSGWDATFERMRQGR
jgi:hypothetical protein